MIIDAQVHAYERNHPGRPWVDPLPGPPEVTGAQLAAAMAEVGVDAAILVSPWAQYRTDASYAVETQAAFPGKFALVKPVDPTAPDVAEVIAAWKHQPGAVAIRIMLNRGFSEDPADPGLNRVLAEAGRHGLPVNLLAYGRLPQVLGLARRNPGTQLVIDHCGMQQPYAPPAPSNPFADLPNVLALAECPNVAIKLTGACTYAHQPFPYPDIWGPIGRLLDAFGLGRCLWGTDWTRAADVLTYRQGVEAFLLWDRLSASDRAMLMGGSVQRVYRWTPGG